MKIIRQREGKKKWYVGGQNKNIHLFMQPNVAHEYKLKSILFRYIETYWPQSFTLVLSSAAHWSNHSLCSIRATAQEIHKQASMAEEDISDCEFAPTTIAEEHHGIQAIETPESTLHQNMLSLPNIIGTPVPDNNTVDQNACDLLPDQRPENRERRL